MSDTPIYDALKKSRLAFGGKRLIKHVDAYIAKNGASPEKAAETVLFRAGEIQSKRLPSASKPVAKPAAPRTAATSAASGKPGPAAEPKKGPAKAPTAKIRKTTMVRENSLSTRKLNSKGKTGK